MKTVSGRAEPNRSPTSPYPSPRKRAEGDCRGNALTGHPSAGTSFQTLPVLPTGMPWAVVRR